MKYSKHTDTKYASYGLRMIRYSNPEEWGLDIMLGHTIHRWLFLRRE